MVLCTLGNGKEQAGPQDSAAAEAVREDDSPAVPVESQQQQLAAQDDAAASDSPRQPLTPGAASDTEPAADDFVPADSFQGARQGYAFKLGDQGIGYYLECPASSADAGKAGICSQEKEEGAPAASVIASSSEAQQQGGSVLANVPWAAEQAQPQPLAPGPRHHWGQALQYLDRAVAVHPGRRVALLARRDEGRMRFSLRQGVGEAVGRSPWKVEWGGGSSVENPHYQRVHYCQLLVRSQLTQHVTVLL